MEVIGFIIFLVVCHYARKAFYAWRFKQMQIGWNACLIAQSSAEAEPTMAETIAKNIVEARYERND